MKNIKKRISLPDGIFRRSPALPKASERKTSRKNRTENLPGKADWKPIDRIRREKRIQRKLLLERLASYSEQFETVEKKNRKAPNGFTILEMMIVMLVVALLLLITLPNIQQKEKIIRAKGCEALLDIVDSQILLYEIDHLETPGSLSDLIAEGYLEEGQDRCPDGSQVSISGGQAVH